MNPLRSIFGGWRSSTVRPAQSAEEEAPLRRTIDPSDQTQPWYAVEPRAWKVACSAIDVAKDNRLTEINAKVLTIYEESTLRGLGYMYAYLILCKAGEDLLGVDPTRAAVNQLADDLDSDWAAFRNADSVQLRHTLVMALRGHQEGLEILDMQPRIEHAVVAAALVLRRLGGPSADSYRERVTTMLREQPRDINDLEAELEYLRPPESAPGQ